MQTDDLGCDQPENNSQDELGNTSINSINLSTSDIESNAHRSTTEINSDTIDIDQFNQICYKNLNNPKIGYLNINHLRNKVVA